MLGSAPMVTVRAVPVRRDPKVLPLQSPPGQDPKSQIKGDRSLVQCHKELLQPAWHEPFPDPTVFPQAGFCSASPLIRSTH